MNQRGCYQLRVVSPSPISRLQHDVSPLLLFRHRIYSCICIVNLGAFLPPLSQSRQRYTLRKNQAQTADCDNSRENNDNFSDNEPNYSSGSNGGANVDRRASFASTHSWDDEEKETPKPRKRKTIQRQSNSLVDALSDSNSELAHFLLANDKNDEDNDRGLFAGLFGEKNDVLDKSFVKSFRRVANRVITGEGEIPKVGSLGTNKAWCVQIFALIALQLHYTNITFELLYKYSPPPPPILRKRFYSLALEPMEVRRDRIIMLAEAYAIFGWVDLLLYYNPCLFIVINTNYPLVNASQRSIFEWNLG